HRRDDLLRRGGLERPGPRREQHDAISDVPVLHGGRPRIRIQPRGQLVAPRPRGRPRGRGALPDHASPCRCTGETSGGHRLEGDGIGSWTARIERCIKDMEDHHWDQLEHWHGDMSLARVLTPYIKKLISGGYDAQ